MGITAQIKFLIQDYDIYNAGFSISGNFIEIGRGTLTIETLIHEISEIETRIILRNFGLVKDYIEIQTQTEGSQLEHVSHLISPHGLNSFLSPCKSVKEKSMDEEFLEE